MNIDGICEAHNAISVLRDIKRAIFDTAPYGSRTTTLSYAFGGDNKRVLSGEQAALVLRALYDDAVLTLEELGVDYSDGV